MEAGIKASIVIDKALGLLTSETVLFRRVLDPELVRNLELELKMIRPLIEKIALQDNDDAKSWLKQVADIAQRLEVVINTYLLRVAQRRNHLVFVFKFISGSLASEVQDILEALERMNERASQFFISQQITPHFPSAKSYIYKEESEVVGIDYEKEQLLSVVVGKLPSTRLVISVAGVGGVGKTTLAKIVYDNVRSHFNCFAWITVSESYDFKELLRALASQMMCFAIRDCICDEINFMRVESLSTRLISFLSKKRYLIVLDDVKETKIWERMNLVLPDNNNGSRIIITTSCNSIADSCNIVQNLQRLSEERALELFRERAFGFEFKGKCPPEFEELSIEIVRRCHGLPLEIRTIADLLSQEKVASEWRILLHHFNGESEKMPFFGRLAPIIFSHSYNNLPFHIRPCLLYFGIFPEDFLLPDLKLYKLWIAEGFIKEERGKTLEQVAATYLNQLIERNLVQVSYVNYYSSERICKIPAFGRDIIFSSAKDFGIYKIISNERSFGSHVRHLSLCGDTKDIAETIENSDVRSVFLFNRKESLNLTFMVNLFERFKLLESLDFENAPLDHLSDLVGSLFSLKYLSLRNTKVKKLPESVGLLLNLQTLDVRNTLMHELPTQILKLRKLQHLLASAHNDNITFDSIHGVRIKEGIGRLDNLQTLVTVQARSSGFRVIKELKKLIQLRWLSISKLTAGMANILCAFIKKMNHLESLSLYSYSDHEIFYLESISSPPPSLRRVILTCRLEKLPDWVSRLQNLTVLCLSFSNLVVEPLKALQYLPNLVSLWLHRAYIGNQLDFVENSFQKLKQLILTELHNLRMMRIEEGALPILEELRIGPTSDEFSSDIQHLINLQVLEYYDMPDEYVLCLQPGGSAYWKVEHVPSVVFRYRVRGGRYASYKLGEPGLLTHVKGLFRTANVQWHDRPLSFFYKDDEELAATPSTRWSEQRSFFSDDIED